MVNSINNIGTVESWLRECNHLIVNDFIKNNVDNLTINQLELGYANDIKMMVCQRYTDKLRPIIAAMIDSAMAIRKLSINGNGLSRIDSLSYAELFSEICDEMDSFGVYITTRINLTRSLVNIPPPFDRAVIETHIEPVSLVFAGILGSMYDVVSRFFDISTQNLVRACKQNYDRPINPVIAFDSKCFSIGSLSTITDSYIDELIPFKGTGERVVIVANDMAKGVTKNKMIKTALNMGIILSFFGSGLVGAVEPKYFGGGVGWLSRFN